MPSLVTLADIRTQVRNRADLNNSQFVTDAELNFMINLSAKKLYNKLVAATEDYYTISGTISTDGVTDTFNLPTDFFKLIGVDYEINGRPAPMAKFMFEDRHKYINSGTIIRYRILKNTIVFKPIPAPQTITVWYVPALPSLSLDADTFDSINGWEKYIICECAIQCRDKEEQDTSVMMAEMADIEKEIQSLRHDRDQGKPDRVTDISNSLFPDRYYFGVDE